MVATTISIRAEQCKKDGLCVRVCPVRIFAQPSHDIPTIQRADQCVLCGQCLAICQSHSIVHSRLDVARQTPIVNRTPVPGDQWLMALRQRRSVRTYRPDALPRELLQRLVEVAGYAPTSAHGGEGWARSVTVVAGAEPMRRVAALTAAYLRELCNLLDSRVVRLIARVREAPRRGRAMVPDLQMRLSEYAAGRDAITYEAPAAVFVHTPRTTPEPEADCDAALFAIMLAAHAHGLGTCWNGWLAKAASAFKIAHATALKRYLEIPEHHTVGAAMTLGYPTLMLHSVPERRTQVHWVTAKPDAMG